MTAARKIATYDDLLGVPDGLVAQLVDGEVIVQPRPASPHARAMSKLTSRLGSKFDDSDDGPGGWIILIEPELHLGAAQQQVVVPDLAGWRRTTMPELPHAAFFTLVPDWICEGLSPATAKFDRGRKTDIYAEAGVGYVWLVDPHEHTLEVYALTTHLGHPRYVKESHFQDDEAVTATPFEALTWQLGALWSR
jgi:Uma2 family endonuclease